MFSTYNCFEGVVEQWSNPLTLQPEQSGGQSSISGTLDLSLMTRGHRLNYVSSIFAIPGLGTKTATSPLTLYSALFLRILLEFGQIRDYDGFKFLKTKDW